MSGAAGRDSDQSQQTQTQNTSQTQNQDRRQVVDNGAVAVNADNSSVNLTLTDQGAVRAAADIAGRAIESNNINTQKMTEAGALLSKAAGSVIEQAMQQQQAALQTVASIASMPLSFQDPDRAMKLAGFAVVGVAAFYALKGK